MVEIISHHHIRRCPLCDGEEFMQDYQREEIYCKKCGLIISSSHSWNENLETIMPHSPMAEARNGVHYDWIDFKDVGKLNNRDTTTYRHKMTNKQLMKKGY